LDKGGFVVVSPRFSVAALAGDVRFLEGVFELIVGYVVPVVVLDQGLAKLLTKSAEKKKCLARAWCRVGSVARETNFILVEIESEITT
jgi:hypothetical protein